MKHPLWAKGIVFESGHEEKAGAGVCKRMFTKPQALAKCKRLFTRGDAVAGRKQKDRRSNR